MYNDRKRQTGDMCAPEEDWQTIDWESMVLGKLLTAGGWHDNDQNIEDDRADNDDNDSWCIRNELSLQSQTNTNTEQVQEDDRLLVLSTCFDCQFQQWTGTTITAGDHFSKH